MGVPARPALVLSDAAGAHRKARDAALLTAAAALGVDAPSTPAAAHSQLHVTVGELSRRGEDNWPAPEGSEARWTCGRRGGTCGANAATYSQDMEDTRVFVLFVLAAIMSLGTAEFWNALRAPRQPPPTTPAPAGPPAGSPAGGSPPVQSLSQLAPLSRPAPACRAIHPLLLLLAVAVAVASVAALRALHRRPRQ